MLERERPASTPGVCTSDDAAQFVVEATSDDGTGTAVLQVVFANDAAVRLLGAPSAGEVLDGPQHTPAALMDLCRTAITSHKPWSGKVVPVSGGPHLDVMAVPVDGRCVVTAWPGTERVLVEQLLEDLEPAPDAVLSGDLQGRITYWGPAAERMFGWTAEEALGQPGSILAPRDEWAAQAEHIRLGTDGVREVYETTRVRKDGTPLAVEVTSAPVRGSSGEVVRTAVLFRDITERVANRERLAASEARLRLVTENSRDAIGLTRGGEVEWMSPAIEEILGIPAADVTGADLAAAVHPDDATAVAATRARLDEGETVELRCRVRHRDGTWHWVDLRTRPLPDPDGASGQLAVTNWRVVDDEVAYVQALADSEARNRELATQLQHALDSRVLIEQAKGMIAGQRGITPEEAFVIIRAHGRAHGRKLADVTRDIVELGLRP